MRRDGRESLCLLLEMRQPADPRKQGCTRQQQPTARNVDVVSFVNRRRRVNRPTRNASTKRGALSVDQHKATGTSVFKPWLGAETDRHRRRRAVAALARIARTHAFGYAGCSSDGAAVSNAEHRAPGTTEATTKATAGAV